MKMLKQLQRLTLECGADKKGDDEDDDGGTVQQ